MNSLPPLSVTRIQIADDAVNRVPSNASGTYTQQQQQRLEKPSLTRRSTEEVEAEEEKDERDLRKKQVRSHSPTCDKLSLIPSPRLSEANTSCGAPLCPSLRFPSFRNC